MEKSIPTTAASASAAVIEGLLDRLAKTPASQDLRRRLEREEPLSCAGLAPGTEPLLAVVLHRLFPGRQVVLVADGVKRQESFFQDVQTWLALSSHPSPAPLYFPSWEILPHEDKLPHADVISERLEALIGLCGGDASGERPVLVTQVNALQQRTFDPAWLKARIRTFDRGGRADPLDLVEWLEDQGYEPEAQVNHKGEIALRGGILDVFPLHSPWPVRFEFFGDEIESLRYFDPITQMSREAIERVTLSPGGELGLLKRSGLSGAAAAAPVLATLAAYLPPRSIMLLGGAPALEQQAEQYALQIPENDPFFVEWSQLLKALQDSGAALVPIHDDWPGPAGAVSMDWQSLEAFRPVADRASDAQVAERQRRDFFQQIHRWLRQGLGVHVVCNNEGERQRFGEIWLEYGLGQAPAEAGPEPVPATHLGSLSRGLLCQDAQAVVITDAEIFGRYKIQRPRRLKSAHAQSSRSLLDVDFTEFEEGELVVHLEHGIGRYLGLTRMPAGGGVKPLEKAPGAPGETQECLAIEYAPSDPDQPPPKLYVPVTEAHLVGKYVGAGKARPPLSVLGGGRWRKAKDQAAQAVRDLAGELLSIQAARDSLPGFACAADTAWQREFEGAFLFEETPDQMKAILDTKADQERAKPMDRLICGDVGYGKTEVAIRAAFKTVMNGRQAAILVPTTVLAQQHYNTFTERMADYPVRMELLSRFRSPREQQNVLRGLAAGSVDIVIGTHRLIQKDIAFKNLGLVVIDEEQRFGVLHKEQFKRMRQLVDVLTLSATPIPRTLYLALTGARDMSTIETPPQDRLPVETIVCPYDERVIRDAIRREMNRQGQVFYLHNRVLDIETKAARLQSLVPQARILVGHGQMPADALEDVMTRFVNGQADVLLSTTIIESGLDIPNANTIIIDRADRFGLSDLYQLRGRVGRYKHQAYAYLLIPRHARMLTDARKRIGAIKQYSTLGSGFKIAMRDLEIRGAGNLLGPEQSGHIAAVGFDLYCQLLKQSVAALKGQPVPRRVDVQVRLDFLDAAHASIPHNYIPDSAQRLAIYRKLGELMEPAGLESLRAELRDRFGAPPPPVEGLLHVAALKLLASQKKIGAIESRDDKLLLTRGNDLVTWDGKFPRLTRQGPKARLNEIGRLLRAL